VINSKASGGRLRIMAGESDFVIVTRFQRATAILLPFLGLAPGYLEEQLRCSKARNERANDPCCPPHPISFCYDDRIQIRRYACRASYCERVQSLFEAELDIHSAYYLVVIRISAGRGEFDFIGGS
jgi:hypothetical protein